MGQLRDEAGLSDARLAEHQQRVRTFAAGRLQHGAVDRPAFLRAADDGRGSRAFDAPIQCPHGTRNGNRCVLSLDPDRLERLERHARDAALPRRGVAHDAFGRRHLRGSFHQPGSQVHHVADDGIFAPQVGADDAAEAASGRQAEGRAMARGAADLAQFEGGARAAGAVVLVRERRQPEHDDEADALVVDDDLLQVALVALQHGLDPLHQGVQPLQPSGFGVVEIADLGEQHGHLAQLGEPFAMSGGQACPDGRGDVAIELLQRVLVPARQARRHPRGQRRRFQAFERRSDAPVPTIPFAFAHHGVARLGMRLGLRDLDQRRPADHEIGAVAAAQFGRGRRAVGDADTHRQRGAVAGVVPMQGRLDLARAGGRALGRRHQVGVLRWPQDQQRIAGEFQRLAAVGRDDGQHLAEIVVEEPVQLLGARVAELRQPGGQRREAGDVGEHDRRVDDLRLELALRLRFTGRNVERAGPHGGGRVAGALRGRRMGQTRRGRPRDMTLGQTTPPVRRTSDLRPRSTVCLESTATETNVTDETEPTSGSSQDRAA